VADRGKRRMRAKNESGRAARIGNRMRITDRQRCRSRGGKIRRVARQQFEGARTEPEYVRTAQRKVMRLVLVRGADVNGEWGAFAYGATPSTAAIPKSDSSARP
jgi:hypothetical protein